MRQRSLLILTSVLTTGALTLTACGSRDSGGAKSGGGSGTTVVIGVDAPLTGANSATGLGVRYGAQIAIDDANKNKTVDGVTFKIEALDDKAQPGTGQQNATTFVSENDVMGVVGPLNSGVAQSMQQVFNAANLVEISPSNTTPDLTQGPDWAKGKKTRPYKTYFRTATTDVLQGAYAAEFAYSKIGKGKVFVVDDKQAYGAGLATIFKEEFAKRGGKVVGTDHVNTGDKDFSTLVTKIKNSGADLLYYGGQYDEASVLTKQLKAAGDKIPLFGGDAVFSDTYISTAGSTSEGDYVTSVGAPLESLPAAKEFIAKYKAAGYKGDYGTYGGYSYDAANAIVNAVKKVVDANHGKLPSDARAKIVQAVQNSDFQGITGKVSFDEYGDTTNKQLTVYKVTSGKWKAVQSGPYTG